MENFSNEMKSCGQDFSIKLYLKSFLRSSPSSVLLFASARSYSLESQNFHWITLHSLSSSPSWHELKIIVYYKNVSSEQKIPLIFY